MKSKLCDDLGIEFPLFAFSHCRDVVAAVSRAGGMGVFGAVAYAPEELRTELEWIDANCGGKPYGIDLLVPQKTGARGDQLTTEALLSAIPDAPKALAKQLMDDHGIPTADYEDVMADYTSFARNLDTGGAEEMLQIALDFPIRLIANALGPPPQIMFDMARAKGVPVAALVGSKKHAERQLAAGIDILIAAGGEAGGHCGEIATMVLVPEVVSIAGDTPVLAAGGIVQGDQMAAAMAMGAAGAWCGSVWLTTAEGEPADPIKDKMLAATSADTIRSRCRTGKHSRMLAGPWSEAWETGAVDPLPMPFQTLISEPALRLAEKHASAGHEGAERLASYWVGQGVGLMNQRMSAGAVVQQFKEDYLTAVERLTGTLGEG